MSHTVKTNLTHRAKIHMTSILKVLAAGISILQKVKMEIPLKTIYGTTQ